MFLVADIEEEARKIIGTCSDTIFFNWVSDGVQLIAQKGEFEGWKGFVDICVGDNSCVTLPREVETVQSVNIGGNPALGLSQVYNFHLNGLGDFQKSCQYVWQDGAKIYPTYRDISIPSKVVAYSSSASDNGKSVTVLGFDNAGHKLRYEEGGVQKDGYKIVLQYGYAVPEENAPLIGRITRILKDETVGPVRVSTTDNDGAYGTLLGVYEPDETLPVYRRIQLVGARSSHVRIAYRKVTQKFTSKFDHIPLSSRLAMLFAIRAIKKYSEEDVAMAHSYEVDAARLELEAQATLDTPTLMPIQVVDMNNPQDKSDYDIR